MWRWLCVGLLLALSISLTTPLYADDVDDLAATIDRRIAERWEAENVTPAPTADDAEFFRRASLHLTGRIPHAADVRLFLKETSGAKRRETVDRLLEQPAYIVNFANVWRGVLLPEADTDVNLRLSAPPFEAWLRDQLTNDVPYDAMVRQLLTASSTPNRLNDLNGGRGNPGAFIGQARGNNSENIAASVARLFLGVRLECAQCHDHPFAKWRRSDFWQFTAFFSQSATGLATIPETNEVFNATYLGGEKAELTTGSNYREEFAHWLTRRDNPYFARATVNRLWYHFFGVGLVDPVDDFDEQNPASHPELLDELAAQFVAHDYDVKFIIRGLMASRAYQLTSRQTDESQADRRLFAKMAIQGLTTDQLFDSLAVATGYFESNAERNPLNINNDTERAKFRELFQNEVGGPVDAETTILQALALMNGEFVENATGLEESTTLTAVAESPFLETAERVRALYFCALSRPPNEEELAKMVQYVDSGGPQNNPKVALGDLFWALLNSSEFILNH